jgi:hypothetical protein
LAQDSRDWETLTEVGDLWMWPQLMWLQVEVV